MDNNKAKNRKFWDKLLKGPKVLSEEGADAMLETVKKLRKEKGFRKID